MIFKLTVQIFALKNKTEISNKSFSLEVETPQVVDFRQISTLLSYFWSTESKNIKF